MHARLQSTCEGCWCRNRPDSLGNCYGILLFATDLAIMATSTDLKLVAVITALQKLTLEQTKNLALQLGVELRVLIDIEREYSGNSRKAHYLQAWLDGDVEASWEKIVAGLRQIGMNVVAANVTSQYLRRPQAPVTHGPFSGPTPSPVPICVSTMEDSAIVPNPQPVEACVSVTGDSTSAPIPQASQGLTPQLGSMQSTASIESSRHEQFSLVVCSTDSSVVDGDRVTRVKATIENLEVKFTSVMSKTRSAMCKKESQDADFTDDFRDALLLLPVAKKAIHVKFFRDSEDEILDAKNVRKLFAILYRYSDYRNYEILLQIVNRFCEAPLKSNMQEYCTMLEKFELATSVDVYLIAISATRELSLAFSKMVVKIDKPASACSLHEIRKLKEALAEKASLGSHSIYLADTGLGSVVSMLQFPTSAVGWVLAAMTPEFLHTHHLIEVTVDGECLITLQDDQEYLVRDLYTCC